MSLVQADNSYAYRALRKACSVDIATEGLLNKSTNEEVVVVVGRGTSEEFHDGSNTWYTINDAVMMGYLWGRAEAAELMMSHASRLGRKIGKCSCRQTGRRKTSQRAQEGWKRIAEKIIDELWRANPRLSQADVVRRISERWAKASSALGLSDPAPSDASLKPFVSQIRNSPKQLGKKDSEGVPSRANGFAIPRTPVRSAELRRQND